MDMNSNPAFERAYDEMMERAIKARKGERKRRLLLDRFNEKLLAQNVWWEVRGDLEGLIPEMEITICISTAGTCFAFLATI